MSANIEMPASEVLRSLSTTLTATSEALRSLNATLNAASASSMPTNTLPASPIAEQAAVLTGLAFAWLLAYHSSYLWTFVHASDTKAASPVTTIPAAKTTTVDERPATSDEPDGPSMTAGEVASLFTLGALVYSLVLDDLVRDMPFLCGYLACITFAFQSAFPLTQWILPVARWLAHHITTFESTLNLHRGSTVDEERAEKQTSLEDTGMQTAYLARIKDIHHLVSITTLLFIWVILSLCPTDIVNPFAGEWKWLPIHLMTPLVAWPGFFRKPTRSPENNIRPELASQNTANTSPEEAATAVDDHDVETTLVERILRLLYRFIFTKAATTLHGIVLVGLAQLDIGTPLTWLVRGILLVVMVGFGIFRMFP